MGYLLRVGASGQKEIADEPQWWFALAGEWEFGSDDGSSRCEGELTAQGWSACGRDASDQLHGALAARARHGEDRARWFACRAAPEEETHPAQCPHCGRAEEAEVSYGDKAFWQDVEEPATDKFVWMNRFALPLCIGTIFVTQEEATLSIVANEATFVKLARHNAASARGGDPRTSLPAAFAKSCLS